MTLSWKVRAKRFAASVGNDERFTEVQFHHDAGNLLGAGGWIASDEDYAALVELGRQAGFVVLADDLESPVRTVRSS